MHDVVIRRGVVVDGTGDPRRVADIAIDGGVITEVAAPGTIGLGHREVDAEGLMVTPGFVDIHTHYDGQASWDPWLTPSSWHGVTTVVGGNCGVGFAPVRPEKTAWLVQLMEGVEDIPGSALSEGISWEWESFPEFLDAVGASPHVIDFGFQLAHGPLRGYVMGDRGASNERATPEDLLEMGRLAAEALAAGALGISTSRTSLHKARDGEFVPGTFAELDELYALADALQREKSRSGRPSVFQMALEHTDVPAQFGWMREFAQRSGATVSFNFSQTRQDPELWRDVLSLLEGARQDGYSIVGQVAGRSIGVLECLEGSVHPFALHSTWASLADRPLNEKVAALRDPKIREALLAERIASVTPTIDLLIGAWDRMYPVSAGTIDYEPDPDVDSLAALARVSGKTPQELALDALLADDGRGMLYVPLFNYSGGDLSLLHDLHVNPATRMGLSDAGAHCGSICDGGMPTFMLSHWTRDRTRGPRLPIEFVVRRQTAETAALFGLSDRGVIAPGMKADINIIDYDRLGFTEASMAYDLPTGARRLVQRGRGYVMTMSGGVSIVEDDEFTGALPGQLIRGSTPVTS
ncbi:MAG: amidohydrolase family protein [Actinomycetes bacterium]